MLRYFSQKSSSHGFLFENGLKYAKNAAFLSWRGLDMIANLDDDSRFMIQGACDHLFFILPRSY